MLKPHYYREYLLQHSRTAPPSLKGDVFVHCETTEGALDERAFGLISEGRRVASALGVDLHAVTVGYTDMPALRALGHRGVRKVYKATISEGQPSCEVEAAALEAVASKHKPSLILFAATPTGAEVSAQLAARLGRGLVSGCVDVRVDESGDLVAVKPLHGGTAHAIATWTTPPPFLASFQPEVLEAEEATAGTEAVVEEFRLDPPRSRVKVEGYFRAEADKLDLSEADIVFGVGRGLGSVENMQTVKEAASLIHATVGGTRFAVDEGFIPHERLIGSSGKAVHPKAYIALGISGALHHTAGIKDAKNIITVNTDRTARMFKLSHLGVVGDLTKVLPALSKLLREAKDQKAPGAEST